MPRPAERLGDTIANRLPLTQAHFIADALAGLVKSIDAAGELVIEVRIKMPPRAPAEVQT